MESLRKMTLKNLGNLTVAGIKKAMLSVEIADGEKLSLARIVGKTSVVKEGSTTLGPYHKFGGEFVGSNLLTGEIFSSSACILPMFVSQGMAHALLESEQVKFAIEVGVKRNDKSVTGYEYFVQPLIEPVISDSLKELMGVAGIVPKLAAPAEPKAPAEPAKKSKDKVIPY